MAMTSEWVTVTLFTTMDRTSPPNVFPNSRREKAILDQLIGCLSY